MPKIPTGIFDKPIRAKIPSKKAARRQLFIVGLFDVLNLFPDLFDLGLYVQHVVRDGYVVGLGAYGVGFSVHLLNEEVQFLSDGAFTSRKYGLKLEKM